MTNKETLEEICRYDVDGKIYENYSGRGMMGSTCLGVTCYDYLAMIEAAASKGIKGARWDQLGKGYIVYWPNLDPNELETVYSDNDELESDEFPN